MAEAQKTKDITTKSQPISCTLSGGDFRDRLAWIAELTRDALRSHHRDDLVLNIRYAPEALSRVREMIRQEQACCAFLGFEMQEHPDEVRVTIRAPEEARAAPDALFEQFVAPARDAAPRISSPRAAVVAESEKSPIRRVFDELHARDAGDGRSPIR